MEKNILLNALKGTDSETARIVEDLIHVLVKNGHIRMSDFNDETRLKLAARQALREALNDN